MTEESNKRRKKSYDCQYCDKSYRKPSKLAEHERSHTGERPYVCTFPGCEKAYFRSTHLKVHEKSHLNIKDFCCSFEGCDAAFSTRQHLQRHEKIHTSPLIKCNFPGCSAEFSKRFQLRWHRASHEKGTHICHVCSSAFDSLPQLEKHKDRVHENPIIYNCSSCQDTFKKWSELRKHVRQNHPFTCSICEKTYARSSNLKQHFKEKHTEHEKVSCEWPGCTSVLQNKRSYKMHIALVHEQDTRYKCDICSKGFPYRSMLERHKGFHTTKSNSSPPQKKKTKKSIAELLTGHDHYAQPKALPCPFANCPFEFTNTYLLKRHLESESHAEDVASFAMQHQLDHAPTKSVV